MWSRRATLRWRSKEMVMTVAYSADDRFIATGHFDGTVVIFDALNGSAKMDFNISPPTRPQPITGIRFHPVQPILLITTSDGCVEKRDVRTGEQVLHFKEEGNEIYCCDYRRDGYFYATGGSDGTVRIYDDLSNKVVYEYHSVSDFNANRPAARMYSVVFSPDDLNMVYAGGWGNTVHVYDLRVKEAEKKNIFGPYVTGDALDVRNGIILAASNRLDKRVELIDTETESVNDLGWPSIHNFCPFCAKMSKDVGGEYIAVGGGGSNGLEHAAFVLERRSGKCVVDQTFEGSINAIAFSNSRDGGVVRVAFGDAQGQTHVFEKPSSGARGPAAAAAPAK